MDETLGTFFLEDSIYEMKMSDVTRLETMIDYAEELENSETPEEADFYREKFDELLNSFDFSQMDISRESDVISLLVACTVGFQDFLEKWKSQGLSFNVTDHEGNTALHHIARNPWGMTNLLPTVKFLLQTDIKPYIVNKYLKNPLHCIGYYNRIVTESSEYLDQIIEEFVDAGIDINFPDAFRGTPLFTNLYHAHDCIEIMLNFGAEIYVQDNKGPINILRTLIGRCHRITKKPFNYSIRYIADLFATTEKVVRHITKLQVLGLYVIEHVNRDADEITRIVEEIRKIRSPVDNENYFGKRMVENFRKECLLEVTKMRSVKLDGINSIYNLATKREGELLSFTYKKSFQEYMISNKYRLDFPFYWFLLRSQFRAAEERKKLLPVARQIIKSFLPLYNPCLDHILKQFTNEEMKEFNRIHSSSFSLPFHEFYSGDFSKLFTNMEMNEEIQIPLTAPITKEVMDAGLTINQGGNEGIKSPILINRKRVASDPDEEEIPKRIYICMDCVLSAPNHPSPCPLRNSV